VVGLNIVAANILRNFPADEDAIVQLAIESDVHRVRYAYSNKNSICVTCKTKQLVSLFIHLNNSALENIRLRRPSRSFERSSSRSSSTSSMSSRSLVISMARTFDCSWPV
jgi:hypothetical protein